MYPEERNFEMLPDQTAYAIDVAETDYWSEPEMNGAISRPLVVTADMRLYIFEGEPGGRLDWHTHMPYLDQLVICLKGAVRYTVVQEDDSEQVMELSSGEAMYLPGGAYHEVEIMGEDYHRELVFHGADGGRLEALAADFEFYDMASWPIALWIDRIRDEVVERDENAVST